MKTNMITNMTAADTAPAPSRRYSIIWLLVICISIRKYHHPQSRRLCKKRLHTAGSTATNTLYHDLITTTNEISSQDTAKRSNPHPKNLHASSVARGCASNVSFLKSASASATSTASPNS